MNENNVKAYYRKATALKVMREHSKALNVAQEGQQKAYRLGKAPEV